MNWSLSGEKKGRITQSVKFLVSLSLAATFVLGACAPVHERQAGGGAFDESEVARTLDANGQVPGEGVVGAQSFSEWREQE